MSLTSNLANPSSIVSVFFKNNFDFYPALGINDKIQNHFSITPGIQRGYQWKEAGHVIEYLASLHSGVKLEELFPMKHYDSIDTFYHYACTFYKTKKFSEFKELVSILYYLSQVEAEIRSGKKFNKSKEPGEVFYEDMRRLFETVKNNELFNNRKSFIYNPGFLLSRFVGGADVDFIKILSEGRFLFDMKTTKNPEITESMLNQLMGYVLLDYTNEHKIDGIAIYMSRQDISVKWKINEMLINCSSFKNIEEARSSFSKVIGADTIIKKALNKKVEDLLRFDFDQSFYH